MRAVMPEGGRWFEGLHRHSAVGVCRKSYLPENNIPQAGYGASRAARRQAAAQREASGGNEVALQDTESTQRLEERAREETEALLATSTLPPAPEMRVLSAAEARPAAARPHIHDELAAQLRHAASAPAAGAGWGPAAGRVAAAERERGQQLRAGAPARRALHSEATAAPVDAGWNVPLTRGQRRKEQRRRQKAREAAALGLTHFAQRRSATGRQASRDAVRQVLGAASAPQPRQQAHTAREMQRHALPAAVPWAAKGAQAARSEAERAVSWGGAAAQAAMASHAPAQAQTASLRTQAVHAPTGEHTVAPARAKAAAVAPRAVDAAARAQERAAAPMSSSSEASQAIPGMSTNAAARTDCAGEQTRQHPEHVAERWQQLKLVAKAAQGDGPQEGARGLGGFLSRLRDGLRVPWVGGVANRRILPPQQAFGVPWLASPSLQRQLAAAAGSSSRATHAAAGRHGALVTGPLRSSSSSAQLGGRAWQHACVAGSGVLRHEGCEQRAPVPPAASSCAQSVPPRRALGTVAQRPGRAWQHACVRGGSTATAALGSGALAHPALNSPGADDCSSERQCSNTADDGPELGRTDISPATRAAGCGSGDAGSSVELQSGPPTAAAAPAADSDAVLQEMRARFGPHWRPFRMHIAWNADNGASESTRVVRAHWRKVHQCAPLAPRVAVGCMCVPCRGREELPRLQDTRSHRANARRAGQWSSHHAECTTYRRLHR